MSIFQGLFAQPRAEKKAPTFRSGPFGFNRNLYQDLGATATATDDEAHAQEAERARSRDVEGLEEVVIDAHFRGARASGRAADAAEVGIAEIGVEEGAGKAGVNIIQEEALDAGRVVHFDRELVVDVRVDKASGRGSRGAEAIEDRDRAIRVDQDLADARNGDVVAIEADAERAGADCAAHLEPRRSAEDLGRARARRLPGPSAAAGGGEVGGGHAAELRAGVGAASGIGDRAGVSQPAVLAVDVADGERRGFEARGVQDGGVRTGGDSQHSSSGNQLHHDSLSLFQNIREMSAHAERLKTIGMEEEGTHGAQTAPGRKTRCTPQSFLVSLFTDRTGQLYRGAYRNRARAIAFCLEFTTLCRLNPYKKGA